MKKLLIMLFEAFCFIAIVWGALSLLVLGIFILLKIPFMVAQILIGGFCLLLFVELIIDIFQAYLDDSEK